MVGKFGCFLKLIALIFVNHQSYLSGQILSPGKEPMIIVGLYHQCPGQENITSSNICQATVNYTYHHQKGNWEGFIKDKKLQILKLNLLRFPLSVNTFATIANWRIQLLIPVEFPISF